MNTMISRSVANIPGVLLASAFLAACSANSGPGISTTTVQSAPENPPTISLAISPKSLKEGESATATWESTNATSCQETGSWSGPMPLSDTDGMTIGPEMTAGTYTFGATCTGPGGTASVSQTITVGTVPAPGIDFQLLPASIKPGDSATLVWSTTNATSCTGSGGTGTDAWAASQPTSDDVGFGTGPVTSAGQYTYELDCTGPGGTTVESRVLTVDAAAPAAPPAITFNATKTFLQPGDSTSLNWSTSNTTGCAASGGTGSDGWSGTMPVSSVGTSVGPLNSTGIYSYTLTCSGAGGSASKSVNVDVSTSSQPPPVSVTIDVSPAQIVAGQSASLTWSSSNAQSCTASGSWSGSKPLTGSNVSTGTLTTAAVYSYSLSCVGIGGSTGNSATATLTVNPPAATIANFNATPTSIQTGQSSSLSWTSNDASRCTASGGTGSDGWTGTMPTSNSGLSTGPINTAGTYTYTLACTGAGGDSSPQSVTITATASPPAASVSSFHASPSNVQRGQPTVLSWTSNGATSCTASGGSGADAWTGSVPTSSVGLSTGALNTAGTFLYTLTCTGPGGASPPSTTTVNVTDPAAPASIVTFSASPATVLVGQSSTLSWTTAGATACTASGGTGSDGWNGTMPASSVGTSTGALNTAGVVTYSLTCTGPGGASTPSTATVTVNSPTPGQPTVTLQANHANPAQVPPGQTFSLSWISTNASSCSASGGTGSDGWNGAQPVSSSGMSINAISTPGVYSYTLTCTGAGGTGSSTVAVTIISSASADCGIGAPSTMLLAPAATASGSVHGICLAGCSVANPGNVTTASTTDYATMAVAVGALAYDTLDVTDTSATFPAGRKAGFLMSDPDALLDLSLLEPVSVVTLLNGTVQETATLADLLQLQALGLLNDPTEGYVDFKTTKPFNTVRLTVGSLASVLSRFRVYGACVSLQ